MFFAGSGGGDGDLGVGCLREGEETKSSKSSKDCDIEERADRSRSPEFWDSGLRIEVESEGAWEGR